MGYFNFIDGVPYPLSRYELTLRAFAQGIFEAQPQSYKFEPTYPQYRDFSEAYEAIQKNPYCVKQLLEVFPPDEFPDKQICYASRGLAHAISYFVQEADEFNANLGKSMRRDFLKPRHPYPMQITGPILPLNSIQQIPPYFFYESNQPLNIGFYMNLNPTADNAKDSTYDIHIYLLSESDIKRLDHFRRRHNQSL